MAQKTVGHIGGNQGDSAKSVRVPENLVLENFFKEAKREETELERALLCSCVCRAMLKLPVRKMRCVLGVCLLICLVLVSVHCEQILDIIQHE